MLYNQINDINKIIIIGCGGYAKVIADAVLKINTKTKIIFFKERCNPTKTIWKLSCSINNKLIYYHPFIVAIGDNKKRMEIFNSIKKNNNLCIISRQSQIGKNAKIANGSFIANFCLIGPEVRIGKNTIINNGSIIEHETSIGNHCHIAPNATICGKCKIGDLVFIGAGSTIINNIKICSNVTIGAGSTVIKNIEEQGTYVGSPVKKIK